MDEARAHREAEAATQQGAYQQPLMTPSTSMGAGTISRKVGASCLVPVLCNERFPKDFKGPHKVPNYTADLPPKGSIESYELVMEMLDVNDAVCAKYFTMILEVPARTWLKNLPPILSTPGRVEGVLHQKNSRNLQAADDNC